MAYDVGFDPHSKAARHEMIPRRFANVLTSAVLACAAALLLSSTLSATTLLALIDKKHHRVVLAADSMLNYQVAQTTVQTCKIVARPACVFGMAGLFYKEYPPFKLQELAQQACDLQGDLQHRADAFLEIAREPIVAVGQYLLQNEPRLYADLNNGVNGGELIIVLFVGAQNGQSVILARGYRFDGTGGIKPVSSDVTEDRQGVGFFGGANQAIAAYIKAHKNWQKMDKVAAARKFVQLEIDASPQWVGPPISIVTVNHLDQKKWVDPGVCASPPPAPTAEPKNDQP